MKSKIWTKKIISSFFPPFTKSGGRILLYHSIAKPHSNDKLGLRISPQEFEMQIRHLIENDYKILSLNELIDRINQDKVTDKTISITFDDGYNDNFDNAFPILSKYNLKFTVFVSPAFLDGKIMNEGYWSDWEYLNWNQLFSLISNGVDIGCHSRTHKYLTCMDNDLLIKKFLKQKRFWKEKRVERLKLSVIPMVNLIIR